MRDIDRKNVTIHLDSKLYDNYSELCKNEGLILSRQVEKFIRLELEKVKQ